MSTLSERLRAALKMLGMNITQASEQAGIPYRSLQNYARGEREPSAESLAQVVIGLGISADWLLTGSGDPLLSGGPEDCVRENPVEWRAGRELGLLTEEEVQLIDLFRRMPEGGQAAVISLAQEREQLRALQADLTARIAELDRRGIRPEEAAAGES